MIVGAGEQGEGINSLIDNPEFTVLSTDVYLGSHIDVVADAHDLPFPDDTFDAVVIQAVLEHVIDPQMCVGEIYRVLKHDGLVYAETPFLFPVHLDPYDFTRFTRSGHRRLFRKFAEIDSGMSSGPATMLALAIRAFFMGMSNGRLMSGFVTLVLPYFIFWIKYLDTFMIDNPQSADYAATFFS